MAVPKQRHTKSRRDKRRANIFLRTPALTSCPKCGKPRLAHFVCPYCGYYKGAEVIDVLAKLTKKERKAREKEMAAQKSQEAQEAKGKSGKSLGWEELSKK